MADGLTFDEIRDATEADLRSVAKIFSDAADTAAKGDLGQMDMVIEGMPKWAQMLAIRHENRLSLQAKPELQIP